MGRCSLAFTWAVEGSWVYLISVNDNLKAWTCPVLFCVVLECVERYGALTRLTTEARVHLQ